MSDSAPSDQRTNSSSARKYWLLAIGLATVAILVVLGVYLFRRGPLENGRDPFAATTAPAHPQTIDPDDDPFADLAAPSQQPGNPSLPFSMPAEPSLPSQTFVFLSNKPGPELAPPDMGKVASAEVMAVRRRHVAASAAELEHLSTARRDALFELAKVMDAQPDAPPSRLLDLLDAEHAAHQARLASVVELAARIEMGEAYSARLAKLETELKNKHSADDPRDLAALHAAQAESTLELAREQYRDQLGPAEVAVLEDTAARLQELFNQVDALYQAGEKGGEAERRARAGYECSRARARLARACGDRPATLAELHRATEFAHNGWQHDSFGDDEPHFYEDFSARRNQSESLLELIEYARLMGDQQQIDWAERGGS